MSADNTSRPVTERIKTTIWKDEIADNGQPRSLCHGYDYFGALAGRYSWSELCYLLIKGELPNRSQIDLLNIAMSAVINPGPKHWATQAAMTTAVTKTTVGNTLLSGLSVLQGRYDGALAIEASMSMLKAAVEDNLKANDLIKQYPDLPGYDLPYGKKDFRVNDIYRVLQSHNHQGRYTLYALKLDEQLSQIPKQPSLTLTGLFAAMMLDLEFSVEEGHGLFLIAATPGLIAHALEQLKGNWNDYPFYDAPEYSGVRDRQLEPEAYAYPEIKE